MNSNNPKVVYRPLRRGDMETLSQIVIETWQFDDYIKTKSAHRYYGISYLSACLLHSTFVRVAEVDGRAVGIIIISDHSKKKNHLRYRISYAYHTARYKPFEINDGLDLLARYGDVMEDMDKACPQKGSVEIKLFIVKKGCRGLGIGLGLFGELLKYLKDNGQKKYYVHTDTACNYPFYEARGMRLLEERKTDISYAGQKNVTMFLYGAEVTENSGKN